MAIGANDAGNDIADHHAIAHLRNGRVIMLAEYLERGILEYRRLRLLRDLYSSGLRLALHVLGARCIAELAPRRHGALPRPLDAAIGINAGRRAKLAGALLIRDRSSHLIGSLA